MNEQPQPRPNDGESMHDAVIAQLEERKRIGIERYSTILQTFNGRDAGRDLIEELADAMVYAMQLQRENEQLRAALHELNEMIDPSGDVMSDELIRLRDAAVEEFRAGKTEPMFDDE